MSEDEQTSEPAAPKASKMPIIVGVILALLGAGGGFFAVQSGALDSVLSSESTEHHASDSTHEAPSHGAKTHASGGDTAFIPVSPVVISLPPGHENRHLRFAAQLEVGAAHRHAVEDQLPRVVDVFNAYLRAVKPENFQDPVALMRIRSHLLARLDVVLGEGWVEDLLIMEFVLT